MRTEYFRSLKADLLTREIIKFQEWLDSRKTDVSFPHQCVKSRPVAGNREEINLVDLLGTKVMGTSFSLQHPRNLSNPRETFSGETEDSEQKRSLLSQTLSV